MKHAEGSRRSCSRRSAYCEADRGNISLEALPACDNLQDWLRESCFDCGFFAFATCGMTREQLEPLDEAVRSIFASVGLVLYSVKAILDHITVVGRIRRKRAPKV